MKTIVRRKTLGIAFISILVGAWIGAVIGFANRDYGKGVLEGLPWGILLGFAVGWFLEIVIVKRN